MDMGDVVGDASDRGAKQQERAYRLRQLEARRSRARLLGWPRQLGEPPDWILDLTREQVQAQLLIQELQAI